jgi:hypothetical protein
MQWFKGVVILSMKKQKAKKKPARVLKPAPPAPAGKGDDPLDFGGLPSRDIKRNLGCG